MQLTILLATYNGQKYLREQLDSIVSQSYKDWRLLVHDDGSTDNTIAILKDYAILDGRIQILEDGISGLGAAHNFLHLLKHAHSDFIMFADQDDVWLPDKVKVMMENIDSDTPAMAYCNANSFKADRILPDRVIMFHPTSLNDTLFLNGGVHGCLQIINKPLRDLIINYNGYVCMHDHLITLAAVCLGRIKYIDKDLMYYRQHLANVTVGYETRFTRKLLNFFASRSGVIDSKHQLGTIEFFKHFKNHLSKKQRETFSAYFRFASVPVLQRIGILLKHRFRIGKMIYILLFKTLLRKPVGSKS